MVGGWSEIRCSQPSQVSLIIGRSERFTSGATSILEQFPLKQKQKKKYPEILRGNGYTGPALPIAVGVQPNWNALFLDYVEGTATMLLSTAIKVFYIQQTLLSIFELIISLIIINNLFTAN